MPAALGEGARVEAIRQHRLQGCRCDRIAVRRAGQQQDGIPGLHRDAREQGRLHANRRVFCTEESWRDGLIAQGWLAQGAGEGDYELTANGALALESLGVEVAALHGTRRLTGY